LDYEALAIDDHDLAHVSFLDLGQRKLTGVTRLHFEHLALPVKTIDCISIWHIKAFHGEIAIIAIHFFTLGFADDFLADCVPDKVVMSLRVGVEKVDVK
jgi:hypothetical protein